ncbi:MAG: DUF1549 domain-containing protein, partial [Armatimonadaceae bacterium]
MATMKRKSGIHGRAMRWGTALWTISLPVLLGAVAVSAPPPPVRSTAGVFPIDRFESRVRPVLLQECASCHGAERAEAGLRLDRAPGAGWAKRIAGALDGSGAVSMPPSGRLESSRKAELIEWANAGAPWPVAVERSRASASKKHWSLKPVTRPNSPTVSDSGWSVNPIDRFVRARMAKAGLRPAPEADRRTLIRRATWEMTGLMPTSSDVETFLADRSPNAWEKVVDRLLESPAYGERWGRYWLDL